MEQLTIEELAPYLPYGLKGDLINPEYYESVIVGELFRIETGRTTKSNIPDPMVIVDDTEDNIAFFKPYLRPLSQLTEVIEHKGERFTMIDKIQDLYEADLFDWDTVKMWVGETWTDEVLEWPYSLVQILLKYHFDVFGLIDRGLALPIPSIK